MLVKVIYVKEHCLGFFRPKTSLYTSKLFWTGPYVLDMVQNLKFSSKKMFLVLSKTFWTCKNQFEMENESIKQILICWRLSWNSTSGLGYPTVHCTCPYSELSFSHSFLCSTKMGFWKRLLHGLLNGLLKVFTDFAASTGIHGLGFLVKKSYSVKERLFWAAVFLALTLYASLQLRVAIVCKYFFYSCVSSIGLLWSL